MASTKRSGVARPGRPVRGSTTGRPLMAAMDLLGRRWALRRPPSVLYERLRELAAARLIEQDSAGDYVLTGDGQSLGRAIRPLDAWSEKWAGRLRGG